MDRDSITFSSWNKVAQRYADAFMDLSHYNESYTFFGKAFTNENARIVEIGCGPGNICRTVLAQHPSFQWRGYDVAPAMISIAQQFNPSAYFEVQDCRNLSFITNEIDGIIAGFCLPYFSEEEVESFLKEAHSKLTENGILYISFVHGNPTQSGFMTGSTGDSMYFYYHDEIIMREMLNQIGFEIKYDEEIVFNPNPNRHEKHRIIIAQRAPASPAV